MIQLSKDEAIRGDRLLKDLCEHRSITKDILSYFTSEDETRMVCRNLKERGLIIITEMDTTSLFFVNPSSMTCSFLNKGGLVKEYQKMLEKEKLERLKNRLDKWKYYVFWPATILGAFGGIYSLIDLFW